MKIKTRFFIVITIVILGLFSIGGLAGLVIYKISTLQLADATCHDTIHSLKDLQLLSAELLSTNDLDATFKEWCLAQESLSLTIEALNRSDHVQKLLAAQNQRSLLDSLYAFWLATGQKLNGVKTPLVTLVDEKDHSKNGLILQYQEVKNYVNLINRNNVYEVLRYLNSEFETKLNRLITLVDLEIKDRYFHLILQIATMGFLIGGFISLVLISFLRNLEDYLRQLHHSMEIIGKGDFSEKLVVSGEDELSQISRAINRTTDNLKRFHTVLEERVDELFLAKEEAEKASQAKNIFLANMGHEFRTPLNAIIGFSNHIYQNTTLNSEERKNLSIISKSGNHLLSLINSVLTMSKIEAGKTEVHNRKTNLQDLLSDVHAMFRFKAEKKHLSFDLICHPQLPVMVHVDDVKLWQILINLINNAIKFTARGGVKVFVRTDTPPSICFAIKDTGPGMTVTDQAMIFDPFVQLETDNRGNEGTGLGLAICRSYIRLMGGKLDVKSARGLGSTFSFSIPAKMVSGQGRFVENKPADPMEEGCPGPGQGRRIQADIRPDTFEKIPENLVDELEQATIKAEMDKINLIIDAISRYNSDFAYRLGTLAEAFDYNQIGTLLKNRRNRR